MFQKIVGFPPKSSILIGCSIINRQFWGTLIFGNTHIDVKLIFGFRINAESEAIGILCGSQVESVWMCPREARSALTNCRHWNPRMFHKSSTSLRCCSCLQGMLVSGISMSVLASWWACLVHISLGCYAMPCPIKEGFRAMANGVSSSQHDSGRRVSWAGIGKGNQVELQRALPCLATFEMTCQLCLSWAPVADWLDESSIMYKQLEVGPGSSIGKRFAFQPNQKCWISRTSSF